MGGKWRGEGAEGGEGGRRERGEKEVGEGCRPDGSMY